MVELGSDAADFNLLDTAGNKVCLSDFKETQGLLVIFMCNHCPYVKHLSKALSEFAKELMPKGLSIVAINSNDADNYPDDSPEKMAIEVQQEDYIFPYCFDQTQAVAKAYQAACTPDFFLYDKQLKLAYRGQFDNSRPANNEPVTGKDLKMAAEAVLTGLKPDTNQIASIGCNIKWKQ